ncbi:MAG: hypothetical protein LBT87_08820 [Treponema sp.]|jgi:hypothetical protein|nr:hypothetical protein [Treponema sp.]
MIGFGIKDPGLKMREAAILGGWIGGLVLVGALLWVLTGPVRDRGLLQAANRSLEAQKESVRLTEPLPRRFSGREPLGRRFGLANSGGSMLIFPLLNGGAALPVGALLDDQGKVDRLIPLGNHGRQIFDRIPRGILRIYIRRIESDEKLIRRGGGS